MKKIEFKIIRDNSYAEEISEILNEEEMDALLSIKYEKYPDLFHSLEKDGIKPPVIVVGIDTENGKLVGVGACTVMENSIGYLNSFRIRREYRSRVRFSEAYEKLIKESHRAGAEEIITTILADNKKADKVLTKQRKNMPVYEFLRNINFYNIKNRNKGSLYIDDEYRTEYEGMKILVKNKKNKVYTACDYKKIYKVLYKFRKVISFLGYPELPEKGKKLNFYHVKIVSGGKVESGGNWKKSYRKALKYVQNLGFDCDFFLTGAYEGTAEDRILEKEKAFKYKSRLYKVYYKKEGSNGDSDSNSNNTSAGTSTEIKFELWDL